MPVINVEEPKKTMFDVGESRDMDSCCEPILNKESKEKSYPNLYLYEIPDELYNSFAVGTEYEVTMKVKVRELSERTSDSEDDGKETRRTVELKVIEISKPQ